MLLVILLTAAAAAGGYLVSRDVRLDRAAASGPATPTPSAVASATLPPAGPSPAPSESPPGHAAAPAAVARVLAPAAADPALGGRLLGEVVDAATGTVLWSRRAETPAAPASTAKLLTAAAVLTVHAPTDRITTTLVRGTAPGTLVLVGGGDPTLSGAAAGTDPVYPEAARLSDLAAAVARARVPVTRIVVDGSLFTGPSVSPDWGAEDVPTDYASPITAVMVDGGRDVPDAYVRSSAPDLAAGRRLAALLGRPGLPVVRGSAPPGGAAVARVESAPYSVLVEQMLRDSDNVVAEVLGRQVALAWQQPATFTGAAAAIRAVLAQRGVDVGAGMRDASGLAAADRLAPATLAAVLRLVTGGDDEATRGVLTGLPVAGWSGTLADRYLRGSGAAPAAGVVRAKTGTLTGVSTLAGTAHDRDGRLLLFAFVADRVPAGEEGTLAAEAALDRLAARLASCGC